MTNSTGPEDRALDFAWRVHGALDSWTGKVDTKASIALAVESAVFGFAVSKSKKGEQLANLSGAAELFFYIGLGFLLLAVASSLLVILPRLNRRQSQREWRLHMIYFGHLRHWDPTDLAEALRTDQRLGDQLAAQLVAMSQVAWRKHAWLQGSLVFLALGGVALLGVAAAS